MAIRRSICWFVGVALVSAACKGSAPISALTTTATQHPPSAVSTILPSGVATLDGSLSPPSATSSAPTPALTPLISPSPYPALLGTSAQPSTPVPAFRAGPIAPENAATLVQIQEMRFNPWDLVMAVSWYPNGQVLAVSVGEDIHIYGVAGWERLRTIKIGAFTHSLAFSPDGGWLAAGSRDGFVRIWRTAELLDVRSKIIQPAIVLDAHRKGANCVVFSPDSSLLVSGGNDAVARVWSLPGGGMVNEVVGGTFAIPSIAFTPDGASLAIVNGEVIRIRDILSGRIVGTLLAQDASFYSVAISPDGHILAAGDNNNLVRLWDPALAYRTGQETYPQALVLSGHDGKAGNYQALIWQLSFSPDGNLLASAGGDATVRLWDPANAELLATLRGHTEGVTSVAFSPDGTSLASGGLDATLRIWGLGQ